MSIEEHPLASRLPKAMSEPSLQPGSIHFRPFAARPDVPSSINDATTQDIPQLSLHVTSFSDATLVGISFPHTLMDALGFEALLRSWSLVLAGRWDEVPPILGAKDDILWSTATASIGPKDDEEFILGRNVLRGGAYLRFLLRRLWEMIWDPALETQMLHLPKSAIDELRRQTLDSINNILKGRPHENSFVTEGDILSAWVAQMVASSERRAKPLTIMRAINARFRLGAVLQTPEKGIYVQNMVLASFTSLSPQIAKGPLGAMALENRRQITEQTTEKQMKMMLQALRQRVQSGKQPTILSADPMSLPVVCNDLTKVNIMGAVDFKPAVLRQGDVKEARSNTIGTMVYHHFQSLKESAWRRHWFVFLGKDHQGGTWIMVSMTRKSSRSFMEAVKNM